MHTSKTLSLLLLCSLAISSCQFNASVNKDFMTGLFTKGSGLGCEEVYLSTDDGKINRNTFTYGETFVLNFNDISGFTKENDTAYPGMSLAVTDSKGDTIMQSADLYSDETDGYNIWPLRLTTDLTVARPLHSGNKYALAVGIWDKKGKGTFSAKLDFDIIPNAQINVESNMPYDEIYLFSSQHKKVVTDNALNEGEQITMIFEGLTGFVKENENVFPGLAVQVTDQSGAVVLANDDLFSETSESGIPEADVTDLVSAQLSFPSGLRQTKVKCVAIVWDKKGNGKVTATTSIAVK